MILKFPYMINNMVCYAQAKQGINALPAMALACLGFYAIRV